MLKLSPSLFKSFANGNLSPSSFIHSCLINLLKQVKDLLLSGISNVIPIALGVAGAILVVNLGWRLFRNFTRG